MGAIIESVGVMWRSMAYWMRYPQPQEASITLNWKRIYYRLQKSLVQRGALSTARVLWRRGFRPAATNFDQPKQYVAVHPFDSQFGVETSQLIPPEELSQGKKKDLCNTGYFGVAPSVLRQVLDRLSLN